ncbi:MAG: hypothetical protein ACW98D_17275 [Promethearchaeota archaeon]|jgi:hypothetical protein
MSNGKGLAYAGLILGLIGAGLGGYVFFDTTLAPMFGQPPSEDIPEINSYFTEIYSDTLSTPSVYEQISGMFISFNTTKTVTLHILYTAYVRIITADASFAQIIIRLNGTTLTTNYYYIEEIGAAAQERFAVNMQNYIPALPPGNYNVTVWGMSDHTSTTFYLNSLYVQTHT